MSKLFSKKLGVPFSVGVVAASIISMQAGSAHSQSNTTPLIGYAWSDTIGWIDLNCFNQRGSGCSSWGLSADTSGTLSGYAWSDNIGWVSANASDLTGCPSSPCVAKISGGVFSGWLKAMSADNKGWDGWISLSGSGYGPTVSGTSVSGYAWGSDVVGWVDFEYAHFGSCTPAYSCSSNTIQYTNAACQVSNVTSCVSPQFCSSGSSVCLDPVISFTPNQSGGATFTGHLQIVPNLVHPGKTTQVHWNVSQAQSCTVTGSNGDSWSGLSSPAAGDTSKAISSQVVYTLSCTGIGSSPSVSESQSVNITPVFNEK